MYAPYVLCKTGERPGDNGYTQSLICKKAGIISTLTLLFDDEQSENFSFEHSLDLDSIKHGAFPRNIHKGGPSFMLLAFMAFTLKEI
uniref:Uncharacterized protein n=1 Tax=Romanomermis culicivorax TaxID=13658 RepID=A0A915J2T8_ROMCU